MYNAFRVEENTTIPELKRPFSTQGPVTREI